MMSAACPLEEPIGADAAAGAPSICACEIAPAASSIAPKLIRFRMLIFKNLRDHNRVVRHQFDILFSVRSLDYIFVIERDSRLTTIGAAP
jgi:hypothetical protein